MNNELEKLWHSYLIETIVERTDKEKEIIENSSEKYKTLRNMLNKEQLIALQEYDNSLLEVSNISERNSFIIGVKFTTRILFEALCDK